MQGRLIFLGTGASVGVPLIGCPCSVCQSSLFFNKRLRTSALIKVGGKNFLIDVGPDFRQQALMNNVRTLDGVLVTHAHYDHTAGMDELRVIAYNNKKPVPLLLSNDTARDIKLRYYYLFKGPPPYDEVVEKLQFVILPNIEGEILFEELPVGYFSYEQGGMQVNGFRFGNLAYLSDIRVYSNSIFSHLKGIKTLIISALRYESSALHFSVEEAVDFIAKSGVEKGWLTHISHDIEHVQANAMLPSHIKMAYDGLELEFEYD